MTTPSESSEQVQLMNELLDMMTLTESALSLRVSDDTAEPHLHAYGKGWLDGFAAAVAGLRSARDTVVRILDGGAS